MADTDLTPEEAASDGRIPLYNVGAYDPVTNPRGFDEDGHTVNLMPLANDVAILGRMARRMALSTRADVLLTHADRALTAEDAGNTHQDRLATAANLVVSAGHVSKASQWAGAAENVEVEPGKFSALHWANRAFAAAASVNLPVAGAGDGLKFLQMKADGSGYQLATIATATAQQIGDGAGTGFVNSETLGPILDAMEAATAMAAGKLPPIGSYLFWPFYSPPPGDNWLEAKGQIVSLTAYPALAAAMPLYTLQYGSGNVGGVDQIAYGISSGSGQYSEIRGLIRGGRRIFLLQTQWARVIDASAGIDVQGTVSCTHAGPTSNVQRALHRKNMEVVHFDGNGQLRHLDLATLGSGSINEVNAAGAYSNYNLAGYEAIYKLANGVLIGFGVLSNNTWQAFKLPVAATPTGWSLFMPNAVVGFDSPRSWQTKNGDVYFCARANSAGNYHVWKTTDGITWTQVANLPQGSGAGQVENAGSGGRDHRDSDIRTLNNHEESLDGQQIVVTLGGGAWVISRDGGASWAVRRTSDFGQGTVYSGTNSTTAWSFIYDTKRNRWLFATAARKVGFTPNGTHFMIVFASADLVTFTKIVDVQTTYVNANYDTTNVAILPLNTKLAIIFVNYQTCLKFTFDIAAGTVAVQNPYAVSPTFQVIRRVEGYKEFDGHILMGYGGGTVFTAWTPNDGSSDVGSGAPQTTGYIPRDVIVNNDDNMVGILFYYNNGYTYAYYNPYYPFNKNAERKLPKLDIYAAGWGEVYRPGLTNVPRVYIRVK